MRPLVQLQEQGVSLDWSLPPDQNGLPDMSAVKGLIKENTRAIASLHASNVSGGIVDIAALGQICQENNLKKTNRR